MKPLGAALIGAIACVTGCALLLSGYSQVRAQQEEAADAEIRTLLQLPRHRQQIPPFDEVFRINADHDIGRTQLVLEAFLPSNDTFSQHGLVATAEDVMDLRMLTLHGGGTRGFFFFIHDFVVGGPDELNRRKWIYEVIGGDGSQIIHFDPPMRIREGDLIILNMFKDFGSTAPRVFVLHGTVPGGGGADTLRVE